MRINYTPLGVVFTDYLMNSVGAGTFELQHDYFTKQTLAIRTAGGGGGVLLTEGVDYTLSGEDYALSALVTTAHAGSGLNEMRYVQIINAAYQACDLYFSGDYTADSDEAGDVTTIGYLALAVDHTILDWENYRTYGMTTAASNLTLVLPTVADNVGKRVRLVKVDAGAGTAILDGEGAEKIGSKGVQTTFTLYGQGDWVEVESNGTLWEIVEMGFNELAYTPTLTGFGTASSVNFSWLRCGNKMKVIGKFTTGTVTATEARISLPASLISDSALVPSIMICGIYGQNQTFSPGYILIESGLAYTTFGVGVTGAALSKLNGNGATNSSIIVSVQFEIPISGWNG